MSRQRKAARTGGQSKKQHQNYTLWQAAGIAGPYLLLFAMLALALGGVK